MFKAVPGPILSRCLILNQFFTFQESKNCLSARKTGSKVVPTLCRVRTKNCLCWARGGIMVTGYNFDCDFKQTNKQKASVVSCLTNPKKRKRRWCSQPLLFLPLPQVGSVSSASSWENWDIYSDPMTCLDGGSIAHGKTNQFLEGSKLRIQTQHRI